MFVKCHKSRVVKIRFMISVHIFDFSPFMCACGLYLNLGFTIEFRAVTACTRCKQIVILLPIISGNLINTTFLLFLRPFVPCLICSLIIYRVVSIAVV